MLPALGWLRENIGEGDRGRRLRSTFRDLMVEDHSRFRFLKLLSLLMQRGQLMGVAVGSARAGSTREWIVSLSGGVAKPVIAG